MGDFITHSVFYGSIIYLFFPQVFPLYIAVVCFSFAQSLCFYFQGGKNNWRKERSVQSPFGFNGFLILWLSKGRFFISRNYAEGVCAKEIGQKSHIQLIQSVLFGIVMNILVAILLLRCSMLFPKIESILTIYARMQIVSAMIAMLPLPSGVGFSFLAPWLPKKVLLFVGKEGVSLALCFTFALLSQYIPIWPISSVAVELLKGFNWMSIMPIVGIGAFLFLDAILIFS